MQMRRLLPPSLKTKDGGAFSMNKGVLPALAQKCLDEDLPALKDTPSDPMAALKQAYDHRELLKGFGDQLDIQISALKAAAAILKGELPSCDPHPVVDLAQNAIAHFAALEKMEPDVGRADLDDTITSLETAAAALKDDASLFHKRRKKHDETVCKQLTVQALALKDVDHWRIWVDYDAPDEIQSELDKAEDLSFAEEVTSHLKRTAMAYLTQQEIGRRKDRAARKANANREFKRAVAEVWS